MLFTGFSFYIPSTSPAHVGCIALGIYLFGIVYSPGEGPVPFTYSAEAYPLYVRTIGMSLATATTWFFNYAAGRVWVVCGVEFAGVVVGVAFYAGMWTRSPFETRRIWVLVLC